MKPSDPGAPKSNSSKYFDPLLEPIPLPEVVESDSDTAWGLWQDSLQSPDANEASLVPPPDPSYDDTAPMDIVGPDGLPKTPR